MAVPHKDWELPNLRIWLTEIDIESDLDFPSKLASRPIMFCGKKVANYNAKILTIYLLECQKSWWEKKSRERTDFGRIKFSSSPFASKMSANTDQLL